MKPFHPRLLAPAVVLLAAATQVLANPTVIPLGDTTASTAQSLVANLLGSGVSVVAGSAQYVGQASASGTFTGGGLGATGLGIDRGVVLTTGDARFIGSSASFPGDSVNKSGTFTAGVDNGLTTNNAPGSSLFATLASAATFNASILSFQFVPTGSTVRLGLVFGSEDYNDLVNAGFPTDVFGVFVNGVNYALTSATNAPISAASVNCGGPTSGFAPGTGGQNCGLYRDNPSFSDEIETELDGLTTLISLSIPVRAGAINAISIGIADVLDTSGDSALMLQAGSFAVVAVPEPSTWALMFFGLGVAGVAARRRSRRLAS